MRFFMCRILWAVIWEQYIVSAFIVLWKRRGASKWSASIQICQCSEDVYLKTTVKTTVYHPECIIKHVIPQLCTLNLYPKEAGTIRIALKFLFSPIRWECTESVDLLSMFSAIQSQCLSPNDYDILRGLTP